MKRRELIRQMALASVVTGAGGLTAPMRALAATCGSYPMLDRTLVNVMLLGGADMRFLFMPAPGALTLAHEDLMWSARQNIYALGRNGTYANYQQMFDAEYLPVSNPVGPDFGIYRRAAWLRDQYQAGKVAIVANAVCSTNRRHDQSILNAEAGEPGYETLNQERDGWGGRLVETLGGGANAVEIGGSISVFNKGTDSSNRLLQVVHAQNTRDIALPNASSGNSTGGADIVTRALKSYYAGRGPEVAAEKPGDWPFHTFFNHNAALRAFGGQIEARLEDCGDLPAGLLSPTFDLSSGSFEQQCRNLHDVCLAADILDVRTISMSYGGWDTHGSEEPRIGTYLEDLFGTDKGLDTATREIAALPSNASDQMVYYFASDFGRQLVTNGDFGTDHGRGIYSILYGNDVAGGVYGDMFPVSETIEVNGAIPLERHGADIAGLTSTERILAGISDWMSPGASTSVVPNAGSSAQESPGLLDNLLAV